ncbi:hypothetical protein IRT45_02295 [Nocardia sp. BSTN01]|uniref:effector-associated constant component EACC1 n=1 Tax=Nocardia sp. BSTN01 TaxID=2783665 RepID=UPI00188F2B12|nr:hypothetical protein [Nocardia sp. BSTN01]MBF4995981.1 hypothetical protein [Nocardia sp. BSTN01]
MTIQAEGGPDELFALSDWFGRDDALRGRVRQVQVPGPEGHMSGVLLTALAVAVGAGGVGPALAKSLTAWLTHRRSDVKLTLTRSDGTQLKIDAYRVDSPQVLRELRDLLGGTDTEQ